jgi:hypothetical protein
MAGNGNNQWTKAAKSNSPADKRRLENWRERFRADMLVSMLAEHAAGRVEKSATQIKAIEIVLDRIEPRLSAVEQTHIDSDATKSESELIQEAIALFKAHPELARQAGFIPAPAQPVDNAVQHSPDTAYPDAKVA